MSMPEIAVLSLLAILLVVMCIYYTTCKHKIRKLLFGCLSGAVLLYPAMLLLNTIGYAIQINIFTICMSVVLGIPGIILVVILAVI